MKIPRDLSGRSLAKALCRHWDYRQVHQEGSHMILETGAPSRQRVVVPDHSHVRVGTLNSILRQVSVHKGVSKEDILATL